MTATVSCLSGFARATKDVAYYIERSQPDRSPTSRGRLESTCSVAELVYEPIRIFESSAGRNGGPMSTTAATEPIEIDLNGPEKP